MDTNQIALITPSGFRIVKYENIIYCAAEGSYSNVSLDDGTIIMVSKNLGYLEGKFPSDMFMRIHHKYLINMQHLSEVLVNGSYKAIMSCGTELEVSARRKAEVMQFFEKF